MRKANYQNSIASGVTGLGYIGNALGTFDGSFFGNSTVYQMAGTLFNNMAAYISQGNNTFTIYNPSPGASSQGYSYNYLQWTAVTITITYEEAVSQPSTSASSVNMGSAVTVYTNRVSNSTTHTLLYTFGNTSGTIATNVGASVSWTPPLTLAAQVPSATNGVCTITCQSYNGGTLTGTRTCTLTLNVPSTVVPSISSVTVEDTNSTVATRIQAYVRMLSTLSVAITAAGTYGSTISSYDAAVNRYEAIKAEREKVAADIRQRGIRRREFERFISELDKLSEAVSEFDETLWGSLVDYVTVGKDKTMVFTLLGGTEMKA